MSVQDCSRDRLGTHGILLGDAEAKVHRQTDRQTDRETNGRSPERINTYQSDPSALSRAPKRSASRLGCEACGAAPAPCRAIARRCMPVALVRGRSRNRVGNRARARARARAKAMVMGKVRSACCAPVHAGGAARRGAPVRDPRAVVADACSACSACGIVAVRCHWHQ